jgi:hypothetical protein
MLTLLVSGDATGDFDSLAVNLSAARIFMPGNGSIYTEVPLREMVDLANVTGNRSVDVLDINLTPGTYSKIELDVSRVSGTLNGTAVNVTVAGNRLEIVHEFTLTADRITTFVFTIGVVKEETGGYTLVTASAKSGVGGKDLPEPEVIQ